MADTARRVLCRTCHKEVSIHDAHPYHIGKVTSYECYECYKQGQREAHYHIITSVQRLRKEKEQ